MNSRFTTVNDHSAEKAALLLAAGELISFPTETVYALAADSRSDTAIARIYAAKGRNQQVPLALLVKDMAQAATVALIDERAEKLAACFFPGPLTLVLPVKPGAPISPLLNQGKNTIAIRIPDHPLALSILEAFGHPVAGTSANISGTQSALKASDIPPALAEHIALIIDGGTALLQTASTIVDLTLPEISLLREGNITYNDIIQCLTQPLSTAVK